MIYLNGPEMTLGDQTGQSLKTTGEKDLQRCNASVLLRKISNHLQDDTSDLFDL